MSRYLLDTNVLSEPLAAHPSRRVLRKLEANSAECATAAPVLHELRFGASLLGPSRRRAAIEEYIERVVLALYEILPYDRTAAEWHAAERGRLTRLGRPPPLVDGIIASIARVNDLILVTGNTRHFDAFEGLTVETWSR